MTSFLKFEKLPSHYFVETSTDKLWRHRYGDFYDMLIASLLHRLNRPIKVLELGVSMFGEGSGHAFARMPFVEQYVGVDIESPDPPLPDNSVFLQVDAYTAEGIQTIAEHGPFDLIIDDCVHERAEQVYFFRKYPALAGSPAVLLCEEAGSKQDNTHIGLYEAIGDSSIMIVATDPLHEVWHDSYLLVKWV